MRRLILLEALVACVVLGSGCASSGRQSGEGGVREAESRSEKRPSGAPFSPEIVVEAFPRASAERAGFESQRVMSGFDDWEPFVAVDPSGPYVYQLTTRLTHIARIALRRSSDGGATWDFDGFILDVGRDQYDPQIAVANDGTLYVLWLDNDTYLTKSYDRGESWTPPVRILSPSLFGSDHAWLAISPDGRDVYVGLNRSDSYVCVSHDYGATFEPQIKTNNDTRYWFHTGAAVGPNGNAYIAVVDFSQNYRGDANVGLLRTTDGGASWTYTLVDTVPEPPGCSWAGGCSFGFFGSVTGLAVDAADTVMIVYAGGLTPGGNQRIWASTSTDGGASFGARTQVSAPSPQLQNGFPAVASGPLAGDFRVVWQGGRPNAFNTWFRRTTDSGARFGPITKLSDQTAGAPYKSPRGYRFPYGDYLGIAVDSGGTNHLIWGEGPNYNGPGGTWYTRGQ